MRCPIVKPEDIRLPLTQGDYLTVKKQLNTGEYREMIAAQYKESTGDRNVVLDLRRVGLCRVLAYLLAWSFVDLEGKPLPVSEGALLSFDHGTFQELLRAIDDHHAAGEAAMEARKNVQDGAGNSSLTSPSAV